MLSHIILQLSEQELEQPCGEQPDGKQLDVPSTLPQAPVQLLVQLEEQRPSVHVVQDSYDAARFFTKKNKREIFPYCFLSFLFILCVFFLLFNQDFSNT